MKKGWELPKDKAERKKRWISLAVILILALYIAGILCQVMKDAGNVRLNLFLCLYYATSSGGRT